MPIRESGTLEHAKGEVCTLPFREPILRNSEYGHSASCGFHRKRVIFHLFFLFYPAIIPHFAENPPPRFVKLPKFKPTSFLERKKLRLHPGPTTTKHIRYALFFQAQSPVDSKTPSNAGRKNALPARKDHLPARRTHRAMRGPHGMQNQPRTRLRHPLFAWVENHAAHNQGHRKPQHLKALDWQPFPPRYLHIHTPSTPTRSARAPYTTAQWRDTPQAVRTARLR